MADFKRNRIGAPGPLAGSGWAASNFALNQTADALEWIFKAADTTAITRIGFRVGALTGTATTWKASLQGVDGTTGFPDGTIKGGGSPASVTFTNSGLSANNWFWFNLANSYTPAARGEDLALVIAYDSGTAPSTGVNDLSLTTGSNWPAASHSPYIITNDNAVRTKNSSPGVMGYGSASKAYGYPSKGNSNWSVNSGSNPNEAAFRFLLPAAWGSTFKVVGVRCLFTPPAAATNSFIMRLYDGTTVIQDVTIDEEIVSAASTARFAELPFDEASLSTLNFGSEYRIAFAPQTATSIIFNGFGVDAAADWDAWEGGQDFYVSTRNGGAWTDITTSRLFMELILDDWTVPSANTYIFQHEG